MKNLFKKLFRATSPSEAKNEVSPETPPSARAPKAPEGPELIISARHESEWQEWLSNCKQRSLPQVCDFQQDGSTCYFKPAPDYDVEALRVAFVQSLMAFAKRPHFPEIDSIRGFAEFHKGNSEALQVRSTTDAIAVDLTAPPGPGFLYTLERLKVTQAPWREEGGEFVATTKSPVAHVRFEQGAPAATSLAAVVGADLDQNAPAGFRAETYGPVLTGLLVLRPARELQNQRVRQILVDQVSRCAQNENFADSQNGFFLGQEISIERRTPHPRRIKLQQPLRIAVPAVKNPGVLHMEKALATALKELGWPALFEVSDQFATHHDIRIQFVETGSALEAWRAEFLFLSPLGPQLPDPSSRIKTAGKNFLAKETSAEAYAREFYQALHDDAAILPMCRQQRFIWLSPQLKTLSLQIEKSVLLSHD